MGTQIGGKVTGVASEQIDELKQKTEKLRKDVLHWLIEYYAAPIESAGDVQRAKADKQLEDTWRQAVEIGKQIEGIEELKADARAHKNDLGRWLKLTS